MAGKTLCCLRKSTKTWCRFRSFCAVSQIDRIDTAKRTLRAMLRSSGVRLVEVSCVSETCEVFVDFAFRRRRILKEKCFKASAHRTEGDAGTETAVRVLLYLACIGNPKGDGEWLLVKSSHVYERDGQEEKKESNVKILSPCWNTIVSYSTYSTDGYFVHPQWRLIPLRLILFAVHTYLCKLVRIYVCILNFIYHTNNNFCVWNYIHIILLYSHMDGYNFFSIHFHDTIFLNRTHKPWLLLTLWCLMAMDNVEGTSATSVASSASSWVASFQLKTLLAEDYQMTEMDKTSLTSAWSFANDVTCGVVLHGTVQKRSVSLSRSSSPMERARQLAKQRSPSWFYEREKTRTRKRRVPCVGFSLSGRRLDNVLRATLLWMTGNCGSSHCLVIAMCI